MPLRLLTGVGKRERWEMRGERRGALTGGGGTTSDMLEWCASEANDAAQGEK